MCTFSGSGVVRVIFAANVSTEAFSNEVVGEGRRKKIKVAPSSCIRRRVHAYQQHKWRHPSPTNKLISTSYIYILIFYQVEATSSSTRQKLQLPLKGGTYPQVTFPSPFPQQCCRLRNVAKKTSVNFGRHRTTWALTG